MTSRAMPAPPARVTGQAFVSLAQLYARYAEVESGTGERYSSTAWSEIDVVQWLARQPRARATFRVRASLLGQRVRDLAPAEWGAKEA